MMSYCKGYRVTSSEVWAAYLDWAAHESGHKNAWRVVSEYGSPGELVAEIVDEVRSRSLRFRPMRSYEHVDGPSGKVRTITVESVKQQVCDYLAVRALQPMLDDKLGFWQYGSAHVRDAHDLAVAVMRWQHGTTWWSHGDVRHCYQSIRTDMLMRLLGRYVRSDDVLYLLGTLLDAQGESLTLGSYLSLRLAQLVLSFGYHHVESLHRERRGRGVALVTHQCWYMDDFWLMGTRKRDVQAAMRSLERYLSDEFGLELHPWQACRVGDDEPMDVAGWVVRPGRITLRGSSFLRADRALRRFRANPTVGGARSLASHKGQWHRSRSRGYRDRHDVDEGIVAAQRLISLDARRRRLERP